MTNSKKDSRPNQYTFPDGTIIDFGNRDPQKCLDDYVKWLDKKRSKPVDSKKDSELESILNYYGMRCSYEAIGSVPSDAELLTRDQAIQAITSKYITKEESDRRVLEGRIEELDHFTDKFIGKTLAHSMLPNHWVYVQKEVRIAELRELLNGDKEKCAKKYPTDR